MARCQAIFSFDPNNNVSRSAAITSLRDVETELCKKRSSQIPQEVTDGYAHSLIPEPEFFTITLAPLYDPIAASFPGIFDILKPVLRITNPYK
jgi:hypothetical protein